MKEHLITRYSDKEERLNVITHGFGLLLSSIGFPFLILKSLDFEGFMKSLSFIIYGVSMIVLYAASTFYHLSKEAKLRRKLNIFDHAAIYILIAGTYTPFTLIVLEGTIGWVLFGLTWGFALTGVILKLFYTGKFDKLSTVMYVLMGWQIIFAIKPLIENFSREGLSFLVAGGVFYTIGAILYSIKKLPYNHAIFHVFVVLGSFSHFLSIYFYI
ncbi:hemolysin III family protein [Pseudotenacibaculum sp. MALMAid0570]|uniref:PAQR family membrane homeostasis protein TrhA n=1 Tax=Pseudotenacibaculum sp. MALMAid0570 TaxID=3143938 RepID=UPI0032DFC45A